MYDLYLYKKQNLCQFYGLWRIIYKYFCETAYLGRFQSYFFISSPSVFSASAEGQLFQRDNAKNLIVFLQILQ